MRQIKFRAWHKQQGCIYYTQSSIGMEGDGWIESIDFDSKFIFLGCQSDEGDYVDHFPFADVELMQYTGLKDKNGKDIYEGDVVEYKAYNIWHRDEVKFTDGKFHGNLNGLKEELQSRYDLDLIVTLGCEVIGNIYENPELLTKSA